jgi:hypothetical protein
MLQPKKPVKVVEKKTTKVTTKPKAKTVSQRIGDITLRDVKDAGETALNLSTLGGYGVAKRKIKELMNNKNGGTMKKAKSGLGMKSVKSGYDNNSGVTRADFVAIGKGKAQNGKKLIKSGVKGMSENEKVKKGITKLVPSSSQIKANVMPPKKKMGGKMAKQAAVAIAMKKAGKKPKKAMMGASMSEPMMKSGGKMAKCKYGCK